MPEEEEIEEAVDSIRDLSEAAELAPCPNCGEMTQTSKNVCDSCGFLIRGPKPSEEEETVEDVDFRERLSMTLKSVSPSTPRPRSARIEEPEVSLDAFPELTELAKTLEPEDRPPKQKMPVVSQTGAVRFRRSRPLVAVSTLIVVVGIVTYLLSFLLVSDKMLAGAAMIVGAVLIVVFGNVAVEGAIASRRPVLVTAEGPRQRMVQYACPVCKTLLREEESTCPLCGSVFES